MIEVRKNGRRVAAMVLNEHVNGALGIAQCMIAGCEAHIVVMQELGDPTEQIHEFMMEHDCDPSRYPERRGDLGDRRMNRPVRTRS